MTFKTFRYKTFKTQLLYLCICWSSPCGMPFTYQQHDQSNQSRMRSAGKQRDFFLSIIITGCALPFANFSKITLLMSENWWSIRLVLHQKSCIQETMSNCKYHKLFNHYNVLRDRKPIWWCTFFCIIVQIVDGVFMFGAEISNMNLHLLYFASRSFQNLMLSTPTGKEPSLDCSRQPIGRQPICQKKGKVTQSRCRTGYRVGKMGLNKWSFLQLNFNAATSLPVRGSKAPYKAWNTILSLCRKLLFPNTKCRSRSNACWCCLLPGRHSRWCSSC